MSNNSSGWLAPEKRRGFQGKLRLKKNRSGTAAQRRAAPAAVSGHQGLQAPIQAAVVSNESTLREAHNSRAEQAKKHRTEQDHDPCDEGTTVVGSPKVMPGAFLFLSCLQLDTTLSPFCHCFDITVTLQPALLDRCDLGDSIQASTLYGNAYGTQMYDFHPHAAG